MANTDLGELYFIAGIMVLILIMCIGATYVFIRQYKREKGRAKDPVTKENGEPKTK